MKNKVLEDRTLENKIHACIQKLKDKKATIGFAESCTGGRLSALWAEEPGVSEVYLGSIISYSNEVKVDLLSVDRSVLLNEGAVSETVAKQMCQGLAKRLKTTWAVSITGVAGPGGGTPSKPVGTVFIALKGPEIEVAAKKQFEGNRIEIQNQSVEFAVQFLLENL